VAWVASGDAKWDKPLKSQLVSTWNGTASSFTGFFRTLGSFLDDFSIGDVFTVSTSPTGPNDGVTFTVATVSANFLTTTVMPSDDFSAKDYTARFATKPAIAVEWTAAGDATWDKPLAGVPQVAWTAAGDATWDKPLAGSAVVDWVAAAELLLKKPLAGSAVVDWVAAGRASVDGQPGLYTQFGAVGHDAFPHGAYPRRQDWLWMWQQMVYCLPFNDHTRPTDGTVGSDYDVGPYKIGDGGRPMTGGTGIYPAKGSGSTSGAPGEDLAGNSPLVFPGGTSSSSGTVTAAQFNLGAGVHNPGLTPTRDFTYLIVATPRDLGTVFTGRALFESWNIFNASRRQAFFIGNVAPFLEMQWILNTGGSEFVSFAWPDYFDLGDRVVFVLTQTTGEAHIYVNGRLAGSKLALTVDMPGTGSLFLGGGFTDKAAISGWDGSIELFATFNQFWTADQAQIVSAQPFSFLEPEFPARPLGAPPIPPVVGCVEADARLRAAVEADPNLRAAVEAGGRLRAAVEANPALRAAVEADARLRAAVEAHARICPPKR
jgi:hypothetical protein